MCTGVPENVYVLLGARIRGRRIAVVDFLERSGLDHRLGRDHDPVTRVTREVPEVAGQVVLAMVEAR
jgi:hypothetical protein